MKKYLLIALFVSLVLIFVPVTYSRYFYSEILTHILETEGFYFNSTTLSSTGTNHFVSNFDGVNTYTISVDVNSRKNSLIKTNVDVSYDIAISCPEIATCRLSKTSGVISHSTNIDSYSIDVTPTVRIESGQSIAITTVVTSTEPYVTSLRGTFNIGVTDDDFLYQIKDSVNASYLEVELTNNVSFYKVREAFGDYPVGKELTLEEYNSLSSDNKKKCYSALVTLTFDPNILLLDLTDTTYVNKLSNTTRNVSITEVDNSSHSYSYVDSYTFVMGANTLRKIIFYKNDITQNYAYPIPNNSPIVNVSYTTAAD